MDLEQRLQDTGKKDGVVLNALYAKEFGPMDIAVGLGFCFRVITLAA